RGQIVLACRGGAPVTAAGGEALDALAAAGVVIDRDDHPQVLVADPATVGILADLARVHAGADDPMRASAAEAVAWCTERADFPGTSALVDLAAVSAVALVAGVPPRAAITPRRPGTRGLACLPTRPRRHLPGRMR